MRDLEQRSRKLLVWGETNEGKEYRVTQRSASSSSVSTEVNLNYVVTTFFKKVFNTKPKGKP